MDDYLAKLASTASSYPTDLSKIPGDMLNESPLTKLAKMRLLSNLQNRYLKRGVLSPIERYGQSSASAMAQGDGSF